MAAKITVYEKPTCTTCKNLAKLLKERGIEYNAVNYFFDPLSEKEIRELIKKLNEPAFSLIRTKEPLAKELGLGKETPESEIIDALVRHPELLNRPVVVFGNKAIVARPAEKVLEIL
ncbi:MAG TPA: ArsC/Spx/MgsR family protein [Pyrinomonadaceae bacterium]|nr:ArsC/Spx/MgsR family protein [Pyrinomonadaceae bacterium]